MEVVPQTLQEYVTANGKIPFRDWLAALRDVRVRARVRVRLNHMRLGNFGDARPVGDGISE
jgi:putative addiction module killer protein